MSYKMCEFDKTSSSIKIIDTKSEEEILKFELKRNKSKSSNFEKLFVDVKLGNDYLCSDAEISPECIKDGILQLKKYGVVLDRPMFNEVGKEIENNYINIKLNRIDGFSNELTETKISEIFKMICKYIEDYEIKKYSKNNQECYNIPVNKFAEYIKESDYKDMDMTQIRNGLRDTGYTICNSGRNDRTVMDEETKRAVKVISFLASKVEEVNADK